MMDEADLALIESHLYHFAENLMLKYAKYLDIKLCNSILKAIRSVTIEDDTMTIHPEKLKVVLHDIANAMAVMFNVTEKTLQEARDKIEAIFEQETESLAIPISASTTVGPIEEPVA